MFLIANFIWSLGPGVTTYAVAGPPYLHCLAPAWPGRTGVTATSGQEHRRHRSAAASVNTLAQIRIPEPRLLRAFRMKGSEPVATPGTEQDGFRGLLAAGLAQLAARPGTAGWLVPVLLGKHI